MDPHQSFIEIAIVLAVAATVGLVGMLLRQPLIVAFMAVGILAGPGVAGLVHDSPYITLMSELGVAVLLFVVGLKLDLGLVRTLGVVSLATGLGQVLFTSAFGLLICLALGFDPTTSAYVAVALTFSSTIIIVKLLSDKREVDHLHGRIALGFLIVQDIAVVIAMIILSTVGVGQAVGTERSIGAQLAWIFGGGAVLLVALGLFIRLAAERLMRLVAAVPELMVTFAIAWAVGLAVVTDELGFGKEVGGLLAGVAFASTSFREALASRLGPLRDFLLLFFFVGLGLRLELGALGAQVPAALVLSAFVLVGNPLIVLVIMGLLGYRKRTGLLAGLTVAQISEFSLIFMAMGLSLGHVDGAAMGLVTLVGMITITSSTYMILYSQALYRLVEPLLWPFERRHPYREARGVEQVDPREQPDVVLIGMGRYGRAIYRGLLRHGRTVLGVDSDPEVVRRAVLQGRKVLFGDASDPGLADDLPLGGARWVVIATTPGPPGLIHADPRYALLHAIASQSPRPAVAVIARDEQDAKDLRARGADLVLEPFVDAAIRAIEQITGEWDDLSAAEDDEADAADTAVRAQRAERATRGRA